MFVYSYRVIYLDGTERTLYCELDLQQIGEILLDPNGVIPMALSADSDETTTLLRSAGVASIDDWRHLSPLA